MDSIMLLPAALRVLEYSSNRRFKIKDSNTNFDDEIGKNAMVMINDIKYKYGIDILKKEVNEEQLTMAEHWIGNAISIHVKKKLVPRKLTDEIELLKESKPVSSDVLNAFEIDFSQPVRDFVATVSIDDTELLNKIKIPQAVSLLPGEGLMNQYFTQSNIEVRDHSYYIISVLRHERRIETELQVESFIALRAQEYSKYNGDPTQLFLKGLDKYGIDMNINNVLSRYYRRIEVPLDSRITSAEFLRFENWNSGEPFTLAMSLMYTDTSIILRDVFAIRNRALMLDLND